MVHFSRFLPSLALVAACFNLATAIPTMTSGNEMTPHDKRTSLDKRALLAGQLCASIPVTIPGTFITGPITLLTSQCLCIQGGVLTPQSVASLSASVPLSLNLALAITVYLTNLGVINAAINAAQTQLNLLAPTCNYPANSVPACSTYVGAIQQGTGTCFFTCATDFYNCGQFCIPLAQNCVSGIPQRRDLGPSASLCPSGLSACYLVNSASLAKGKSVAWECMDTQNDIEACGGCQFPQMGEAKGADCTELAGVDQVACMEGHCQAITCIRGYKLEGTDCVVDLAHKPFWVQHV